MGYNIQMKEQDTKYTRCVQRRSRDNDLFTEPEGYTSWATRAEYEGLFNPENQLRTNPMKLYSIDIWPTPTITKEGLGNFDKGFTQNDEDLINPQSKRNKDEQDNRDMIVLPERLFPDLLDQEFDDERTFEIDDEQSDPIKSLSVYGLKTLCNHFSKVAAATSVNDVITVNVMNMDLQKWMTMAQDMDTIV